MALCSSRFLWIALIVLCGIICLSESRLTRAKIQRQMELVQGLTPLNRDFKFDDLEFAPSFGSLFGLDDSPSLVSINPTTAKMTTIGSPFADELEAQELATIDNAYQLYYTIFYNMSSSVTSLIGIDINTGKIIRNVNLPFAPQAWVGVGQSLASIPNTGELIVAGRKADGLHHFYRVNSKNGKLYEICSPIGDMDILGGVSALDWHNRIYWIQFAVKNGTQIDFYGINIDNGKIVYNFPDIWNAETLDYDPVSGLLYSIGLKVFPNNTYVRTLLTLDSKTGKFSQLSTIPGYFIIDSAMGALDWTNRLYYSYLQPAGNITTTPLDLVAINMNTYKVATSPSACLIGGSGCPWSFEAYNKLKSSNDNHNNQPIVIS